MRDPMFFELPVREQARIVGWAHSCPIVSELTDPGNHNPGRGPEAMLNRYGEVNFWFGFIKRETERLNPALYQQLMNPTQRLKSEPVGKYEPESVPPSHTEQMSPMGTLVGYALPRVFIEQLGTNSEDVSRDEVKARLMRGLDILETAIPAAETPLDLLCLVSEEVAKEVGPQKVLYHALSPGWLEEHGAETMFNEAKTVMANKAPQLWEAYSNETGQ